MNSKEKREGAPLFEFFFVKPVFSLLLVMIIMVGGVMGFSSMVKENYPDLAIPQAIITTEWPGASPEIIEKEISAKIEKKIKSMKGLKTYKSGSRDSASLVAVEFLADAPIEESMQLLRSKVSDAESELPKDAEKPKIEQISVNNTPIVTFAIFGDLDDRTLGEAGRKLETMLERIPGIRKVDLAGERKEIVRVDLLPDRITALGISPSQVRDQLVAMNRDFPLGNFESPVLAFSMKMNGAFRSVEEIREVPVARIKGGRVVRLKEVARVRRDIEKEKVITTLSWKGADFKKAVMLSVFKIPGRDTIALIERATAAMERASKGEAWPWGMAFRKVSDESEQIMDALLQVFNNAWQAMLIVGAILLALLTWREAIIAGLSIPITFMGAFGLLLLNGNTLNQLVIIGMVLALGMLVDVFILVMEGMHDAIYVRGLTFREAAADTIKSYAMPAFAGQLTTILALFPLLVVQGIDGKFIRVIPVTTIICLVVSYILAFLVDIPMSQFLLGRGKEKPRKTAMDRLTESVQGRFREWITRAALSNRKKAGLWLGGTVALLVLSLMASAYIPQILYPKDDGRNLGITIELEPGVQLEEARQIADKAGVALKGVPYLKTITRYVGQRSPFSIRTMGEQLGVNEASYIVGFSCLFTKKKERERLAFECFDELRKTVETALSRIPGSVVVLSGEMGGSSSEDPVQIDLTGDDLNLLRKISRQVQEALFEVPGALDVRDTLGASRVEVTAYPLRESLDFYGVGQQEVNDQIRIWMENDDIGDYRVDGIADDLDIRLGGLWKSRKGAMGGPRNFEEIEQLHMISDDGRRIPMASLVGYRIDQSPQVITRKNGFRCVTVSCKLDGSTVNDVVARIDPVLKEMKSSWPPGYSFSYAGEKESADQTFGSVGKVFVLALFMVFAVLAILFGSFSQPLIIMCTVPFAMIGVFGGFFLAGISFSFLATIGIVSLVGIVVNNAIIIVETINRHVASGLSVTEAAARGAADRLRPIFGTTLTTTAGLVPLAISSPMWQPLCLAIIFGLLVSTGVSLVLVPALFVLFACRSIKKER